MQLDKRKKLEDEAGNKAMEAESNYRACVDDSNSRHRNLLDVKSQASDDDSHLGTNVDDAGAAADQGVVDAGGPDHEGGHSGILPAAAHPHRPMPGSVPDSL